MSALYGGDVNFTYSLSAALQQKVNNQQSGVTISSSANPSLVGQTVTFTADVSGTSPKPTGTVTFKDGATVLGTSTVANNGRATYSAAALGWSHHNVTTYYSGDTEYGAAISPVLDQNVRANTSVTTGSSLNPSVYSQSVTFTTHVTAVAPGTGTPTGSVAYWVDTNYVQTATVNASGDATYTTSSLSGELEAPPQPSPRSYLTGRGRR